MSPVIALALALCPGLQAPPGVEPPGGRAPAPRPPDLEALARHYGERWTPEARAYQIAAPAVVSVQSFRRRSAGRGVSLPATPLGAPLNQGTGVVIDAAGFVVTNAHVVAPDDRYPVDSVECRLRFADEFGGRIVQAEALRVDREWDLALLRIVDEGPFYPLPLPAADDLLIGERVMAIGAPYGSSLSLTAGLLSGTGRDIRVRSTQGTSFLLTGVLQTDAAINPGNSGGPLVNVRGEWIGLCSATLTGAEGVSYAIPTSRVRQVLDERLFLPRVWHGAELRPDSLVIERLHPRGPAAQAGLRVGDQITACDGVPIADAAAWRRRLVQARPGDAIQLGYRREGAVGQSARFVLADESAQSTVGLLGFDASPEQLNVPDLGLGADRVVSVLRVQEVYEHSGAESLGLARGDTIVAVHLTNGANADGWVPVRTLQEVLALVRGANFDFEGLNLWWVKPDGSSLKGRLTFDDPDLTQHPS